MAADQDISEILDETIVAFSLLDANRLETLEQQVAGLASAGLIVHRAEMNSIRTKRNVLEGVLLNSASNLSALNRLYGRDTRDRWEHSAR